MMKQFSHWAMGLVYIGQKSLKIGISFIWNRRNFDIIIIFIFHVAVRLNIPPLFLIV